MNVYRNNKDMEQLMKAFCLLRNKKIVRTFFMFYVQNKK